jgi:hypothetical protein
MATKSEMLTAAENAIQAIMTGGAVQSYSFGGRSLQRMSLKELRDWRDQLKREIAAESNYKSRNLAEFDR